MTKTNAMRILESAKIPFTTREYTVDEDNLSGIHVANEINLNPDTVFKTLVTKGDKTGVTVFCIAVNTELDLKKAALSSGNKKIEMILMKDLLGITGYIRGGCSPIGMKKKFPTFIDETAILFDEIAISAGVRGCQIIVEPQKLCDFIDGTFCDISKE